MTRITEDMLTPWFPVNITPVRPGLYEVRRPVMFGSKYGQCLMEWTGTHWTYAGGSYTEFGKPYDSEANGRWRGLNKEV